jgi:hypothetical protein
MMEDRDPYVEVQGAEIIVTLPNTNYTVTYYKPSNSPQLLAKRFPGKDDPTVRMTPATSLQWTWLKANAGPLYLGTFELGTATSVSSRSLGPIRFL